MVSLRYCSQVGISAYDYRIRFGDSTFRAALNSLSTTDTNVKRCKLCTALRRLHESFDPSDGWYHSCLRGNGCHFRPISLPITNSAQFGAAISRTQSAQA